MRYCPNGKTTLKITSSYLSAQPVISTTGFDRTVSFTQIYPSRPKPRLPWRANTNEGAGPPPSITTRAITERESPGEDTAIPVMSRFTTSTCLEAQRNCGGESDDITVYEP